MLKDQGACNTVEIGSNVSIDGVIVGNNNSIIIGDSVHPSSISIRINGDNNKVKIDSPFYIRKLQIRCGSHVRAYNTELSISENISIESNGKFLLFNSGNKCFIGRDCLFSNNLTIRCGESPHLIFDKNTGEYLDISEGVFIGDHVWIGERVYITKRGSLPSESVVAACSVVTRRFDTPHSVIAGNPAKVARENVQWIRNKSYLEPKSVYDKSYKNNNKKFL